MLSKSIRRICLWVIFCRLENISSLPYVAASVYSHIILCMAEGLLRGRETKRERKMHHHALKAVRICALRWLLCAIERP